MADDEKPDETPVAEKPVAVAPAPDPRIDDLTRSVAALNDTVQAALTARTPVQGPSGGTAPGVTPQLRAALRQQGLTDADIDHNSSIILPFLLAVAPEFLGAIEQSVSPVRDAMSARELEENDESFPHAKLLRKERAKLVTDAKKEGRQLSQEAAYHTAVSLNLDKVNESEAGRRASTRGADVGATSGLGHRTSASQGARAARPAEPQTKEDLSRLSREERMKLYETWGDRTIQ